MTVLRLIPSLLRVISANYFFSFSNSLGTLTEKSLMSVSEVATGLGPPLGSLKNKKSKPPTVKQTCSKIRMSDRYSSTQGSLQRPAMQVEQI